MNFTERKDWDSNFFGYEVGEVTSKVTAQDVENLRKEINAGPYQFISYRPTSTVQESRMEALDSIGFSFIDTHLRMEMPFSHLKSSLSSDQVLLVKGSDVNVDVLNKIARQLAKVSRFYLDNNIDKNVVFKLYEQWVKNSLNGQAADFVFIIGTKENPIGFVTYKKIRENTVDLSLIAIEEQSRGRGLGKILVESSLSQLPAEFTTCSVKVSASNPAVAFYKDLGFETKEFTNIYHWHRALNQPSDKEEKMNIPNSRPHLTGKEVEHVTASINSYHVHGDGPYTKKCQKLIEEKFGGTKALLTTSCTKAIEMAYILCDVGHGDEVIMPSFGFASVPSSLCVHGAIPVFVDVRRDTLNIDESKIEAAITQKTKAIIVVHYAGIAAEMDTILAIARKHNIRVIEDAAQAIGAKYKGKDLGTIGDLGCYSLHGTKNIVCGEGGVLRVNDPGLIERAEIVWEKGTNRKNFLRGHVDKYTWVDVGSSYLPSDILAAFLYPQLLCFDQIHSKRESASKYYDEQLRPLAEQGFFELPQTPAQIQPNYHIYYMLFESEERRDQVMRFLNGKGIKAYGHFLPLHSSKMGQHFGYKEGDFPVTEQVAARMLRLPLFTDITKEEQDYVISYLKEAVMKNEQEQA